MIVDRRIGATVGALLGVVAAACVGPSPEAAGSAVPSSQAFLGEMRPADLGRDVEAVQLVTVSRDDKAVTVEVRLSVRAERLVLVAQDMLGQRLMTVQWTDAGILAERSPNLPELVSPAGLVADLVAISWPEPAVRRGLERTGSNLVAGPGRRVVLAGHEETMRATLGWTPAGPWTGRMSYRNVRAGYTVDVQSVEQR